MWKKKEGKIFLLVHLCLLLVCLLFPLYLKVTGGLLAGLSGCFLHDYLFLYCPMCGGTRAVEALLHLRILEAFQYNAFVVSLLLIALVLDIIVFVRLLRGKKVILKLPLWSWIPALALLVLFGILRNVLMVRYGYDPTGDLGVVWQNVKK